MNRLEKLEQLEQAMQVVAVREISDIVDVSDGILLSDPDDVKRFTELKRGAAQTMLLMQRIGQYVDTKRGKLPWASDNDKLPESVERDAEKRVVDAITRFRNRG